MAACAFFFFEAEPLGRVEASSNPALDACALCAKPLARNSDIFMYRGDTPFCSEDCRYEQMDHDAAIARRKLRQQARPQTQPHRSGVVHDASASASPPVSVSAAKANVSVAS